MIARWADGLPYVTVCEAMVKDRVSPCRRLPPLYLDLPLSLGQLPPRNHPRVLELELELIRIGIHRPGPRQATKVELCSFDSRGEPFHPDFNPPSPSPFRYIAPSLANTTSSDSSLTPSFGHPLDSHISPPPPTAADLCRCQPPSQFTVLPNAICPLPSLFCLLQSSAPAEPVSPACCKASLTL